MHDQISDLVQFVNHYLARQPSHDSCLRYSALVKEDKVWYPLHAVFRNLRRPFSVFNVQHDKVDPVVVRLLDLHSARIEVTAMRLLSQP